MYVCLGGEMYVCLGAEMYVCLGADMYVCLGGEMYVCLGAEMYVCLASSNWSRNICDMTPPHVRLESLIYHICCCGAVETVNMCAMTLLCVP